MEQQIVKKEPEDISMNYVQLSTSADLEMPSTSGVAIKHEIKEELDDGENFMVYVKEELDTYNENDLKFEAEDEMFLYKSFRSKIDQESDDGEGGEDLSCNIREKSSDSDFSEGNDCLYECQHCFIQFFNKEICSKHETKCLTPRVRVIKEKLFDCDFCSKKYQTKPDLIQHKKYIHKKNELAKMTCEKCGYETVHKGSYNRHMKNHDKKNYLKCHFCAYITAELKTLNAHTLSKHREENKIKLTCKIYECAKCLYSTVRKYDYDNHIKVCLKLKNLESFQCQICPYKTIRKSTLTRHIKTHSKIKQLQCLFCEHKSNEKINLDNHILTKHAEMLNESNKNLITAKVHACKHCKYKSTKLGNFKYHMENQHQKYLI
ncbi:unnamed protein product [Brassicogethes aeneus]|uniref:C2H2-type domain-containing protein n=1 Tax=Brassicogethes aeneus TaxID=1431903 RepID=A0A9P0FDC0_BRAAE|nr:unnamed protein product [Brassicogethes aeneus]